MSWRELEEKAATKIQKLYRGHSVRLLVERAAGIFIQISADIEKSIGESIRGFKSNVSRISLGVISISDTINGIPAFETDAPSVNKSPSVNKIEEVTELSVPIVDTKGSVEISRPYGSKTTDELISIAQDLEQKLRERIQALRTPSLIVTDSHRGRGAMHRTDR